MEKGYGPEEIGARFGVSAHVVRQRLQIGDALLDDDPYRVALYAPIMTVGA